MSPALQAFLPYLSVMVSLCAVGISLWVAVRAGRWRDSEAAKALVERVGAVERLVGLHAQRLEQIEEDIAGLPTKADFARLEGEIVSTGRITERTEQAVLRLEDYMMKGGRS